MAKYDYRCPEGHTTTVRRLISEREVPAACGTCGKASSVTFSPTSNIHIPIAFKQWQTGGVPGGGQTSWSDFHDVSERELAKNPNIERYDRVMSQPRNGAPEPEKGISMGEAYKEAKERIGA